MNRRRLTRPSLKITQQVDQRQDSQLIVELWNSFVGAYQGAGSVEDRLVRVDALADLICWMWLHEHPTRDVLVDVPDAAATEGVRWAEFRINATTIKSYDARYHARSEWARAAGMKQAAAITCTRVGYALSVSTGSRPAGERIAVATEPICGAASPRAQHAMLRVLLLLQSVYLMLPEGSCRSSVAILALIRS
jgi:hypothetical protein